MKLGLWNATWATCVAWSSTGLSAQSPQMFVPLGPAPHNYALPAITLEPYALTETRTSVLNQPVGPPKTTVFVTRRMRDSEGRVRSELGHMEDGHFKSISISLMDPVGHFTATLFPGQKLAMVPTSPRPSRLRQRSKPRLTLMEKSTKKRESLPPGIQM